MKHKQHPQKSTGTKRKETRIDNNRPHKSSLSSAISHALSSGWVQNSGVGFLSFFILLIVAIMNRTQIKAAALGFALAGTLFLWIAAIAVIKFAEPDNPPFAAGIIGQIVGVTRDSTQFFAAFNDALTPVPVLLNIRLVNRQPIPSTISRFKVEIEAKKRPWILPSQWLAAESIPEQMPLVWRNPPPQPAMQMTLVGDRLETIFRTRSLQPHETVTGWVLLDVPAEYDSAIRPLVFRVSVIDTAGESVTLGLVPPDANIVAPYGLNIITPIDISGRQIRHWIDRAN